MVVVKRKNGHEYTKLPMESRKKPAWARVYTLDDGSKWTIFTLATELQKRFPYINISLYMVRTRLNKHTCLDKIFAEPINTRPPITKKESKDVDMALLKLVLRTI